MTAYRVFVEHRVLSALQSFPRREQTRLVRFLDSLAGDPFQQGDYPERDDVGRPLQVIVIGRHALVFWADHSVKEVKVLDLKPAGT